MPIRPATDTGGRPTKLTPDLADRLIQAVRDGLPYATACRLVGITYETLCNWRGRDDQPFYGFNQRLVAAHAAAEAEALSRIKQGDSGWQGSAWFLERTRRDQYGQKTTTEISGPGGGPIETVEVPTDPARIAEVARILKDAGVAS